MWFYFAFLGRFRGFLLFRVGLCWLGGLCGLCGFLCACGVRRIKDLLRVCLSFSPFVSVFALLLCSFACFTLVVLGLSSCLVLFVLVPLWSLLFLFPYRTTRKKKGRKGFPCVLSCPVVGALLDVLKHYRYLLRFIVTISVAFAYDSGNVFRLFSWVVYCLPVFVNS